MDPADYIRFPFALMAVLGLIALIAFGVRRLGAIGPIPHSADKRLSVRESVALDPKRRLVLVRRDGVEHLLLLGGERETIVESHIQEARAEASSSADAMDPAPRKDGPAAGRILQLFQDPS
ncbi:MAG: flagellar biosynthetic protein FliO [Pseudomonadota bacterium]